MKYRIVLAFPDGYSVQKRSLLGRWVTALIDIETSRPYVYRTVAEAKDAVDKLRKKGSVVWEGK